MAEILIEELTTGAIDGEGALDKIMQTVTLHLDQEFNKNRIKGPDYAKVSLGATQAAITQSLQFVLQRQVNDKQAELLDSQKNVSDAQLVGIDLDNQLKTKQLDKADLEIEILSKQSLLLTEQIAGVVQQNLLTTQQIALATQQVKVAEQQELNLAQDLLRTQADTALINKRVTQADDEILLIKAQVSKLGKDEVLIDQQILVADQQIGKMQQEILNMVETVKKTTADTALVEQQTINAVSQNTLYGKQADKVDAESTLLGQKTKTEEAQIRDTVDSVTVTGMLGTQKDLYKAQIEGFARDAEQKLADIYMKSWQVRTSLKPDDMNLSAAGVSDGDIKSVMDLARSKLT